MRAESTLRRLERDPEEWVTTAEEDLADRRLGLAMSRSSVRELSKLGYGLKNARMGLCFDCWADRQPEWN